MKNFPHRESRLASVCGMVISVLALGAACGLAFIGTVPRGRAIEPKAATGSDPSIERGRAIFVRSCAHCHGDDAGGTGEDGDGPDLHGLRISDARIRAVIHAGIAGEMPSFAKKHGDADVRQITAYLRSLR